MNYLEATLKFWFHAPLAKELGWSLIHFLWEGVLVALLLASLLYLCRGASSHLRYGLSCVALLAMPVSLAITLATATPERPAPKSMVPVTLIAPAAESSDGRVDGDASSAACRSIRGAGGVAGTSGCLVPALAPLAEGDSAGVLPGGCAGHHGLSASRDPGARGVVGRATGKPGGVHSDSRTGARAPVGLRGQPAAESGGGTAVLPPGRLVGIGAGARRT